MQKIYDLTGLTTDTERVAALQKEGLTLAQALDVLKACDTNILQTLKDDKGIVALQAGHRVPQRITEEFKGDFGVMIRAALSREIITELFTADEHAQFIKYEMKKIPSDYGPGFDVDADYKATVYVVTEERLTELLKAEQELKHWKSLPLDFPLK